MICNLQAGWKMFIADPIRAINVPFTDGSSKTVSTLLHSWGAESISMGKKEELWNAKPIELPNHAIIKQISL